MRPLLSFVLASLKRVYGVYAVLVWGVCLLIGGALVLILPGLGLRRHVARRALRIMFFVGGTPYRFDRLERVPAGPCVVIANHQSYLDGLVLIASLPPRFAPVIKADMGQMPVIGTVLRRVGSRFVRREPAVAAGRDTLALLEALEAGDSLAVFPEGTFTVDRGLLPFRDGAFFLAAKASVPIVPVGIRGASVVLPEGRILPRPAVMSTHVLEPARADNASREAADTLRAEIENLLLHGLQRREHPWRSRQKPDYAFYCKAFAGQTLPFAYVDLDQLEAHIRAVLEASGGKRLRVDARVLRCPQIIERIMRSNARFHGVKCATVGEALYLADYSGLDDFLVAYPVVRPALISKVCQAIADGKGLTLTVDSTAQLDALAHAIDSHAHLYFRGVLIFDIQRAPEKDSASAGDKKHLHARRKAVVDALENAGHGPALVDCAGAGGLRANADDPSVTEITAGAAFFGLTDASGSALAADSPAAGYASEIMRQIAPDLYATLGGGYTAPDTHERTLLPRVYLPRGAALDDLAGAGAGQLPIYYDGGFTLGDPVFMHPANASELCERFDRLVLLQQGAIVGTAATYRALGDQFVRDGPTTSN